MKKYSVCCIGSINDYFTMIVIAKSIFEIVDKYDNPTSKMLKLIEDKVGYPVGKDTYALDVVCIEGEDMPSPYFIK